MLVVFSAIIIAMVASFIVCLITLPRHPRVFQVSAGSAKDTSLRPLSLSEYNLPIVHFQGRAINLAKEIRYLIGEVSGPSCEGYEDKKDIKDSSKILIDTKISPSKLQKGNYFVLQNKHNFQYKLRRFTAKEGNILHSTTIKEDENGDRKPFPSKHSIGFFDDFSYIGKVELLLEQQVA